MTMQPGTRKPDLMLPCLSEYTGGLFASHDASFCMLCVRWGSFSPAIFDSTGRPPSPSRRRGRNATTPTDKPLHRESQASGRGL